MKTMWKYDLPLAYKQSLNIPTGFRVRHVGPQDASLCVWVEVDTSKPLVPIDFYITGTGHPFPADEAAAIFCGTGVMSDGFVWHVFLAVPS